MVMALKLHPADTLIARKFREIKKNGHEVDNVRKAKTLYHASRPANKHREHIAGTNTVLETGEDVDIIIRKVVDYYFGLRTIGYAYAKAGNHQVDSKLHPGEKVQYSDLSVNLDYCDECLRYTAEKGLPESAALAWLEDIDLMTRSTMVEYMRQGWPQSEALIQSRREHAIDWRASPHQKRVRPDDDDERSELSRPMERFVGASPTSRVATNGDSTRSRGCLLPLVEGPM